METNELLEKVHPNIRLFVQEALKSEIGIGGIVELLAVDDESNGGHLTFSIPYAGTVHNWEILFEAEHPSCPPDFVCISEDFDYDPVTYTQVSQCWDFKDSNCLLKILLQLYHIFKKFQIQQLNQLPVIKSYCQSLLKLGIPEDSLEVYHNTKTKKVNTLLKLNIVAEDLPLYKDAGCGIVLAGLLYVFGETGNVISTSLSMSPYLQRILNSGLENLPKPHWNETFNAQFVHQFTEAVNRHLKTVSTDLTNRRHIVATLMDLYPKNVVAVDDYSYFYCTLLFSIDMSRYVVHFNLNECQELVMFALDKCVGPSEDGCIYNETEDFPVELSADNPRLPESFHELLKSRLTKFISNTA